MSTEMREEWRRNQRPNLIMELGDDCCTDHFNTVALSRTAAGGSNGGDRFLVMGVQRNGQLVPTLILPWTKRSKVSTHTSETSFFKHQQRNKTKKKNRFLNATICFLGYNFNRQFGVRSKLSNNSTARILKPFSHPRRRLPLSRATVNPRKIISSRDEKATNRFDICATTDRQRRGKQMRERTTTSTTTTTTAAPTTVSTTRKGRGQGQRSRNRADNHHLQGQSVRHQHQLQ